MVKEDLDDVNKKIKEQFDKFSEHFNNLLGIKKVSKEIKTNDIQQEDEEAEIKSRDLTKNEISKNFEEGWNNFASGIQDGFNVLKKSMEEQSNSFIDKSEENKNKFNQFFVDMKNKWDTQIKTWQNKIKSNQDMVKADWGNKMQNIKVEYEKWREQQKQEFKEGVKEFSRASIKGAYQFLIFIIPILIILIIVVWVISNILPDL